MSTSNWQPTPAAVEREAKIAYELMCPNATWEYRTAMGDWEGKAYAIARHVLRERHERDEAICAEVLRDAGPMTHGFVRDALKRLDAEPAPVPDLSAEQRIAAALRVLVPGNGSHLGVAREIVQAVQYLARERGK